MCLGFGLVVFVGKCMERDFLNWECFFRWTQRQQNMSCDRHHNNTAILKKVNKNSSSASFLCQKLATRASVWNKTGQISLDSTLKNVSGIQAVSIFFQVVGHLTTQVGVDFGSSEAQRLEKFLEECKLSDEAPVYMGDIAAAEVFRPFFCWVFVGWKKKRQQKPYWLCETTKKQSYKKVIGNIGKRIDETPIFH